LLLILGYIALTVIAISMLILVHEFGHFICAKAVGMRVEVFSIGFWKRLVGVKIGDTDYRVSLVPLGGYVKVTGESPEEGAALKPYEFWAKTPGQRALFVSGGVVMNILMALVFFIVAFAIGVPFTAARVGEVQPGSPAWQAGVQRGDQIVKVNDVSDPVFEQLTRATVLGEAGSVRLQVKRDGRLLEMAIEPQYNSRLGARTIGLVPQAQPLVTGLAKLQYAGGASPAEEGGVRLGDRILAVNGVPVHTAGDVEDQLLNYPDSELTLLVQRKGKDLTLHVHSRPAEEYMLGISGMTATVDELQPGGVAQRAGLQEGDRITAVNGRPVQSVIDLQSALNQANGPARLDVARKDGNVTLTVAVPDAIAARDLIDSLAFKSGNTLTWVKQDGPAYEAGMRVGDKILSVGGVEVGKWEEVLAAGAQAGDGPREMEWSRDGKTLSASITPVLTPRGTGGAIGILMEWPVTVDRRYGALRAVGVGLSDFRQTLIDTLASIEGIATHTVSPRMLGGIVSIARFSYRAAEFGLGKLFYLTAVLSVSIGFLNILPIPILDGGHLLFLAIEKLRGRRVSEKAMSIAQTIGGVLLIMLVVYVTRNDIRNWLWPG
jgi:regulator of sigma E protease